MTQRLLPQINSPADLRKLSVDALPLLAAEIREAIYNKVSSTGGHLAPNLGVVELTIALHYVFDFASDRLLFDVGHQCYPHKLLTGRAHMLENLRTAKGMAGFPDPAESPYDQFMVGHAGTAISTAVGMARGDQLSTQHFDPHTNPTGRRVVSLIGDASIVNGVAMEGLNNAGTLKRQFLVVLNDNGMSISKPQGALSQYFDRLRISSMYSDFKKSARRVLKHVPGGSSLQEAYHRLGECTKAALSEDSWFEHFGLVTVGPIDGHDIPSLIEFLSEAKDFDRPMVLHVKTVKGKGYEHIEGDATTFHSPAAFTFDPDSCRVELAQSGRSFTSAASDALIDVMQRDESVVACTAAMPGGTGLDKVMPLYPDRTWDTGICESHAMDMMAGLAKTGRTPFFFVYSTFLQRAFDQAFQEVSLQGLAVRLCLDRAGLVGGDGAVHHGFCDIALLRTLPDACVVAAIDEPSLRAAMEFQRTYDAGLSALRYPRDVCSDRFADEPCPPFELGKARLLTPEHTDLDANTPQVAVLALGTMALNAANAIDTLSDDYSVALYDARFAKPVDDALIKDLLSRHIPILTIEDHAIEGGMGTSVIDSAHAQKLDTSLITRLGLPQTWIRQNSRSQQLAEVGLDATSIAATLRAIVDAHPAPAPRSPSLNSVQAARAT